MKKEDISEVREAEATPKKAILDIGGMLRFEYRNGLYLGLFAGFMLALAMGFWVREK